jgi:hypothetical protein
MLSSRNYLVQDSMTQAYTSFFFQLTYRKIRFVSQSFPLLPTQSRCRGCLFSLDHTQTHTTVGRTPLDEGSARRRDLYPATQTLYKRQTSMVGLLWTRDRPVAETSTWQNKHCTRQTSMPLVGIEPTIPTSAWPQTHALGRATTGIGDSWLVLSKFIVSKIFRDIMQFNISLCSNLRRSSLTFRMNIMFLSSH